MQTVYDMLTLGITAPVGDLFMQLRNAPQEAGCLEKGIRRATAEIGFIILAVVALIETLIRAILSIPLIGIMCTVGKAKCPEIIMDLALSPFACGTIALGFIAWAITNIYKESLGGNDDMSLTDLFPCMKSCLTS